MRFPLRSASCALAALLLGSTVPLAAQQTRAERSDYRETSTHQDVLDFLGELERRGAGIKQWTMGRSTEGREIPVVLASRPLVTGAEAAHASGKPVVYLQANIHAGEVEGKEAAQMLLRELTLGSLRSLLDSVVLLVVPIYNADGNEAWAPGAVNRPGQYGPETVGRRSNGQGLDLNRDYVKLEAPESRASVELISRWDPDVFIDLHTTNGSYHGYALTWSPGLNPNHSPINRFVQDTFLPEVAERMRERHGIRTFPYGNFRNQEPDSLRQGWETYDGKARYGSNWHAMRNRVSILSEAYSNDPFETRVAASYAFVREVLSLLAEQRDEITQRTREAWAPDSVAVRQRLAQARERDVLAEITHADGDGSHGYARRRRTGEFRTIRMPVWDRFASRRSEAIPSAYLIPDHYQKVVELLRRHGVRVVRVPSGWEAPAEHFRIDSVAHARREFEQHRLASVEGAWAEGPVSGEGAWWLVPTAQQAGVLAAYVLEPASEDGVVAWNLMDDALVPGADYPILRLRGSLASGQFGNGQ
jgi:hypothetical protein